MIGGRKVTENTQANSIFDSRSYSAGPCWTQLRPRSRASHVARLIAARPLRHDEVALDDCGPLGGSADEGHMNAARPTPSFVQACDGTPAPRKPSRVRRRVKRSYSHFPACSLQPRQVPNWRWAPGVERAREKKSSPPHCGLAASDQAPIARLYHATENLPNAR